MPGFLGSQHAFQRGIVKPIKDGDAETLEYLRTRVRPFILRRTKAEVAKDLPPKVESVTCCALEEAQAELYAALARKLRAQVLARVFDASQLMGVNHVSRNADDEQIANARRENGIGHNARIGAGHHNGVRRLAVRG